MPIALEITLILVLAALTAGAMPLLYQLRLTAQRLDAFLLSTSKDLAAITEEVHAFRLRMDHLAGTLQASLDELSGCARAAGDMGRSLKDFQNRFHATFDTASRGLGGIIGGVSTVLSFFKSKRTTHDHD